MNGTLTHEELDRLVSYGSISPALADRVHALINIAEFRSRYEASVCPECHEEYDGPCGGCRIAHEYG
jgi:hypothetical protein